MLLPTAGLLVNIRVLRKDEDRTAYRILRETIDRGEGMQLHTYPSLAHFRRAVLLDGVVMVYEDAKKGSFIGWYHISDSWVARSPSAKYCQTTAVLAKEYQVSIMRL